jgi:hypothetical protein
MLGLPVHKVRMMAQNGELEYKLSHGPGRQRWLISSASMQEWLEHRYRVEQRKLQMPLTEAAGPRLLRGDQGETAASRLDAFRASGPLMGRRSVFVSYVREDSVMIDRIAATLRDNGIDAWLDRTHIAPGERWPRAIENAIRDGYFFIACFSPSYTQRDNTYMNEELRLAIQQLRLMPLNRRWFIPIVLKPTKVPDFPIDATDTLSSFQYIDFSDDWNGGMTQLIRAVCSRPIGQ